MAYIIRSISGCSPDEHPLYFLDANVWLTVLERTGSQKPEPHEEKYITFFEAVIGYHSYEPKLQRKLKNVPKFVMTSLLLSEIINAYMRKVAFVAYCNAHGLKPSSTDYKRMYRPTADHTNRLQRLITDIQAFEDYIVFEDDHFNELSPMNLIGELSANPSKYDMNDLYFARLAALKNWVLVSHDGDSLFDGIIVLTENTSLLRTFGPR